MRLVLASASPRRAELLRAAGFAFATLPVDVDERVRGGEAPAAYVRRLAEEKSAAALSKLSSSASQSGLSGRSPVGRSHAPTDTVVLGADTVVLAADTTVVVDGTILGKPADEDEAAWMLGRLSGRRHDVMTGLSVQSEVRRRAIVETTAVYFLELSTEDIAWYVQSGEGRDKAGGYAIQGLASRFVPRIEGSYSNVVGLPVAAVHELLREFGAGIPAPGATVR